MILVVGGHSRNIGKTSVMAGIIRETPQYNWVALKITQYGHGICSINGKSCHCAAEDHRFAILEEKERSGRTDTSRFLAAGARKSYWVRTKQGMLHEAMPAIQKILAAEPNTIIESNSILEFLKPDLYLMVLDFSVADFKASARRFLNRADACIIVSSPSAENNVLRENPVASRPFFEVKSDSYMTPEVIEFVQSRMN